MQLPPDAGLEKVRPICLAVRDAGGRAFLVGGAVRDRLMGAPPPDNFDLEVYGIDAAALRRLLEAFGRVDAVGESFTVYKLGPIDVSLPRRDSRTGCGHRGFTVTGDPSMSVEEAARRRDFTINAMLRDPLTDEILDPFSGMADLKARVLRAVDPATFGEDSLRVLRGMQFAARFGFSIDPATVALCRAIPLDDLPAERIWGEVEKLLLAPKPSLGLAAGLEMGVMDKLFPELKALAGCPQEPEWHAEGDVWVHTLRCVDAAAEGNGDLPRPQRLAVMLAVLCHDLGKPQTTKMMDGRLRSYDHENAGVEPAARLLDRLNVHTLDGFDVRGQVAALVADHMKPWLFHEDRDRVKDGAFRRLARRCDLDLLYRVAKADAAGRLAAEVRADAEESHEWFRRRAKELEVEHRPPPPLLMGRHLLEMGLPPGRRVGEIIEAVYELQMDGAVTSLEEAREAARRLMAGRA